MGLPELIYRLPTATLKEIIRNRSGAIRSAPRISDKRELARFLAGILSNPGSIMSAIKQTSILELSVLISAVARGGETPIAALRSSAGAEAAERLDRGIAGLERLGLALRGPDDILYVPRQVRKMTPLPPPLSHRLESVLPACDARALRCIAEHVYGDLELQNGRFTTADLLRKLSEPGTVGRLAETLSDEGRRMLDRLVSQDGSATLQQLAELADGRRRHQILESGWTRHWTDGKPRNGVEELLARGLAVTSNELGWGRWRIVVPMEVLSALTGRRLAGETAPAEPAREMLRTPPAVRRHETLIRDIAYLFGFVGRSDAQRTASGTMHRNALKALARGLTVPEVLYASFVYAVSRDAGFLAADGRRGFYEVTARGRAWLEQASHGSTRPFYEAWRARTTWSEIFAEPLFDGKHFRDLADVDGPRESIVRLLGEIAEQDPDSLISLDSLARIARYRCWSRFGYRTGEQDEVDQRVFVSSNQEVVRRIAGESLFWLGLVELTPDDAYVRLSGSGREMLLGAQAPPALEPAQTFVVQPNLEIYAPPNLSPPLLYRLFRVCEPGPGSMLLLTAESLRRAMDRGESAESVLQFLRQHSQVGVPQNVEYLIREMGGRHGHIKVGQAGLYLQVSDPHLLQELKAQKKLKIRFREQLADTVALITGDSVDAVLKELRQAGYLPVSAEEQARREPRAPRTVDWSAGPRAQHASELESRIDWDRIAAEDGQVWKSETGSPLTDAPMPADQVRALLMQAVRTRECVEIYYEPQGPESGARHVVEPFQVAGSLLVALSHDNQSTSHFNINCIRAAALTGESFQK